MGSSKFLFPLIYAAVMIVACVVLPLNPDKIGYFDGLDSCIQNCDSTDNRYILGNFGNGVWFIVG
ncbi:MAG TPA: hypothetical protein VL854_03290 [Nitrososphaeraceae archaeon]|nr:hypothetical protein [Nitrososphaeraceae archaeon]